ncbi:MAG: hypothetical protein NW207_04030, partial [Cytophagales bacterium]|nr:hypothetical protein [Cytophagales bacterium]
MKDTKWLIIILMLLMGATSVHAANETIDPQLQAEIAKETGAAVPGNGAVPAPAQAAQKQLAAPAGASTVVVPTQVIVSPAPQQVAPSNVQQQPTTYVEASPLVQSRADQLRKMRQDAEVGTEQKLVEKIEAARLEDEQKRARKLFGDQNFSAETAQPQQQPLPPQNVYLVPPPVAPAPLAAPTQSPEEVKADIVQSVKADLAKEEEEKKSTRYYFSAGAGVADYADATNISNQSSFGGSLGLISDSGAVVDLGLNYGNY